MTWNVGGEERETQMVYVGVAKLLNGPIPDGYEVHHTCGNGRCINPLHLQVMSENDHRALHGLPPRRVKDPRVAS
jgi:hypothetical protein